MRSADRFVEDLLELGEECNGPSLLRRLGQRVSGELGASAWAFYETAGNGALLKVSHGDAGAIPAPPVPPVQGPEKNRDGSGMTRLSIPLAGPGVREGVFVFAFPADGTSVPPDAHSAALVGLAVRSSVRIASLERTRRLQSRALDLLATLSSALVGVLDSGTFLERLAGIFRDRLGAVAGVLDITGAGWSQDFPPASLVFPQSHAQALSSVTTRGTSPLPAVGNLPLPCIPGTHVLSLPLRFEQAELGKITLWITGGDAFPPPEGIEFVNGISKEISLLVMNVLLHHRSDALVRERQKKLQELWILQETNKALQGTVKLNRILKMILAGATAETGLGFNRAALFLLNERTQLLQGMIGVGPESAEEADRIWKALARHAELGLARQIELYADTQPKDSPFDAMVRGIRISLKSGDGIMSHCVQKKSPVLFPCEGPFPPPEREIVEGLSMKAFAATPIISREQVYGVMVVDNFFDNEPITEEDLRLLSMFAAQAGLAIANAKVHRAHQVAADELRSVRDQLVQSERLAILGEVAANLAHEIRNPLVSIGGFAGRLAKKLDPLDPNRRYATIIAEEVRRLENFLEEVLLFGQDRKPILRSTQLNDVVTASLRFFAGSFTEAGIVARVTLAEDLPPVQADPGQLQQVFVNLFANAVDAMSEGGELEVTSRADPGPPPSVLVSVADSGGGVPAELIGNIFSPFFTTKSSGHGLGLALARRIISEHDGTIEAGSVPGEGLTIVIALPSQGATGEKAFSGTAKDLNRGGA